MDGFVDPELTATTRSDFRCPTRSNREMEYQVQLQTEEMVVLHCHHQHYWACGPQLVICPFTPSLAR